MLAEEIDLTDAPYYDPDGALVAAENMTTDVLIEEILRHVGWGENVVSIDARRLGLDGRPWATTDGPMTEDDLRRTWKEIVG